MSSIRRYLVTMLIAMLTLTSFMAALHSYRESISRADQLFDDDLQMLAASLLPSFADTTTDRGQPETQVSSVVQIWRGNTLLYRSANAPEYKIQAPEGYSEQNFSGQRWRTYLQLVQNAASPEAAAGAGVSATALTATEPLTVLVAQPLKQRQQLAEEVVLASIYPVVLSLPLQALLIWLAVSKGLSPLLKFAEQLSGKKADDLTPVQLAQVPAELSQVLGTTNQLLVKLSDAFAREKRFASDVAHELRTPLSVLQVNLHNAIAQWQQAGVADPQGLMPALQDGVQRMSQLIEQIMLLNRTNPEHFKAKLQRMDLAALCREVIAELYPQILQKNQQVELCGEVHVPLMADTFALRLMLVNLLGNAIKYTPAEGEIKLTLATEHRLVRLTLEDSGPGIDPSEYQRVFDRFYRVGGDRHQSGQPGSGLGLAIVKEIVALHAGSLTLGPSDFASGLKITVELPQ
ncbi:sensor histidine kinase [Rheinheimera sp. 4Y26]|uniref:sensor histidine kinase n=1 Tax=Rheinheimera sp. 4Y26 TaxID=2977811 RepID=UPI0021B0999D|nr:ATP-binding protein [Rheinheimera sp. 4Y26]MCT6699733.1 ATP-binding protein [Rheinheimera sp. 4Y26]